MFDFTYLTGTDLPCFYMPPKKVESTEDNVTNGNIDAITSNMHRQTDT